MTGFWVPFGVCITIVGRIPGIVFDWLVDIIRIHCPGGEEEEDGVDLVLA